MSIPSLVEQCLDAFKECLYLARSDSQSEGRLSDEVGRFRIWVANVSAHTYGRCSLQYRLRDTSILSSAVVKYLKELHEVLQSIQRILLGTIREESSTTEDYSSDEDEDPYIDPVEADDSPSRLALTLDDVDEIVTCLLRISTTLRNPARHDEIRSSNAMSARFFEPRDIEHTKMKFPRANNFLTERLGKGISRHRQYCRYREEHHQKLAAGVGTDGTESEQVQSTVATPVPVYEAPSHDFKQFESDAESVYTDTSYAPTMSGDSNLRPPPWPTAGVDGQPFECPICYAIVSAETELSWYRHVFEDIPPYMCTIPHCKTGARQYNRRREWQHHMKLHDIFWICPYGCSSTFGSEGRLDEHLRWKHRQNLDYNSLHSIANSCLKTEHNEQAAVECPLCQQRCANAKLWFKHVGHHMEQLALFALPQHFLGNTSDDEDNVFDDHGIAVADSSGDDENLTYLNDPSVNLVQEEDLVGRGDISPSEETRRPEQNIRDMSMLEMLTGKSRAVDAHKSTYSNVTDVSYITTDDIQRAADKPLQPTISRGNFTDRPRREAGEKPKGILKQPRERFPEYPDEVREGVAPLKDTTTKATADSYIPPGARWTKIDRRLVNPEALEEAKERFEERLDCVIVLRVLAKEEIQKLADRTREIRDEPGYASPGMR